VFVWLQVEPGSASLDTLITLVLERYKHHPCVLGFGVDVEWYTVASSSSAKKVTDVEAQAWEQKVKSINPAYTLFLKHYATSWMPPTYRGNILFVDDSQQFPSLTSMVSEFSAWGRKFSPNGVAFQFGYPKDSSWWNQYLDPPQKIGDALRAAVPNCRALFWVDFTVAKVFPLGVHSDIAQPRTFSLRQNYPNPFNPRTILSFTLPVTGRARLEIFDFCGRSVGTLFDGDAVADELQEVAFDGSGLATGTYLARLSSGGNVATKKLLLLR
jgi:hypothetical protein